MTIEVAVMRLLRIVSTDAIESVADGIERGESREAILGDLGSDSDHVVSLFDALDTDGQARGEAAAYLRGAAAGYRTRQREHTVEVVWSGPHTHAVPTRSTAEVLKELVYRADRELILVTYSATAYEPVITALMVAVARGVDVTILVETLQGARGAIVGREPAVAFSKVPGVALWHWPSELRDHAGAKMHAKLAVADRRELFTSSVNLTASGVERSIESGVLVRGGAAPQRAAEHVCALKASGVLRPLIGRIRS